MGIKRTQGYQGSGLAIATAEGYALIGGAIPTEPRHRWWHYANLEKTDVGVLASNNKLVDAFDRICGPIVRDAILK